MTRRGVPQRFWFLSGAAIGLIWLAVGLLIVDLQRAAMLAGQHKVEDLASAFEESVAESVREVDRTLLYVRAVMARDGAAIDLRPWISSMDPGGRIVPRITTMDRTGRFRLSHRQTTEAGGEAPDQTLFRQLVDRTDDMLLVAAPVQAPQTGQWSVPFARRLTTPGGAFDGIIAVSIDPLLFVHFREAVDVGRLGRMEMTGLDGVVRASAGVLASVGQAASGPALGMAAAMDAGVYRASDAADGVARLGAFRRVSGLPIVVTVSLAESEVLDEVTQKTPLLLLGGLLLSGCVAGLTVAQLRNRRRAEASEAVMRLAVGHTGVGIMVVGGDGRIEMMNPATVRLLGLPAGWPRGRRYVELLDWQREAGEAMAPQVPPDGLAPGQALRPWTALPAHFRHTRRDGTVLEAHTEVLANGTAICSMADITANEALQTSLTRARDAAEAAVRARTAFLSTMSHEIRTPLNGIMGANDLLRAGPLSPEQTELTGIIRGGGATLLGLITDIIDVARFEADGVDLVQVDFDPAALVREAVASFASQATARGLTSDMQIAPGTPAMVRGDRDRLRRVLGNLLDNAVKFTETGGVGVGLSAWPDAAGWRLGVTVHDTGIGIAAAAVGALFEPFTQADGSSTRRVGGSGLGLALCRLLVQAMGGTITVESVPGRGTTFRFEVAVAFATAQVATETPGGARAAGGVAERMPSVLVAEDNAVNRIVVTRMLELLGCRVRSVDSGLRAVAAVTQGGIDVVIMDVMMPEMDGIAATRAIRALPGAAGTTPIIGLSANAFRSDEDACRSAGMTGFTTKPISIERLDDELSAALGPAAPPSPPAKPDSAEGDMLDRLRATLGDEVAAAVVAAFLEDIPQMLERLREQAAAGSANGVAREAHAVAGSASTLGMATIADAARTMERLARETKVAPDAASVAQLIGEVEAACEKLSLVPVG